jgi:type III restriction enzyme
LEIEKRIHSYPVEKKENYNFDLYQIDYEKIIEDTKEYPKEDEFELLRKGYITYSSQDENVEKSTSYVRAVSGESDVKKTMIEFKMYAVDEVAHDVSNRLLIFDQDAGTDYYGAWPEKRIANIIRQSLEHVNDRTGSLGEQNRQKTLQAFGVIRRKSSTFPRIVAKSKEPYKISTRRINKNSIGVGSLRRDNTVFWDDYSMTLGEASDRKLLKELEEDDSLPRKAMIKVENKYNFKTPLNLVLASYEPERRFIRGLATEQTAQAIDAWIKSLDLGFYSIEYSWRKGEHPKQGSFNPDFFIKVDNNIVVVEIKMDNDVSDENKAKLHYSKEHFVKVNESQKEQRYYFKFLSPESYDLFFKALRENTYSGFISELEAKLEA